MNAPSPNRSLFKAAIGVSILLLLAMAGLSYYAISQLPSDAQIPMHWGPSGEPDGWGSPHSLWLMPGICLVTALLLYAMPFFEPRRGHLLQSSKGYLATGVGTLAFLAGMHAIMVLAALGRPVDMMLYATIGTGLLFILIGACMKNIQSNYIYGIRSRWTLRSELSWKKTHALGANLFMLLGLAMIAAGFCPEPGVALVAVMLIGIPVLLVCTFGYSYQVWKNDPDRIEK